MILFADIFSNGNVSKIVGNYANSNIYAGTIRTGGDIDKRDYVTIDVVGGGSKSFYTTTIPAFVVIGDTNTNNVSRMYGMEEQKYDFEIGQRVIFVTDSKGNIQYIINADLSYNKQDTSDKGLGKVAALNNLYEDIKKDALKLRGYDATMAELAKYDENTDITNGTDLAAAKDALNEASKITKADVTAAEWDALQTAIGKTDAAVKAYETSDKLAADKAKAIAELQRRVDNGAAWNDEMLEAAKNAINAVTDTKETYDSLLAIGIAAAKKVKDSATFVSTEAELTAAISSATAGDCIKLTADINLTAQLSINTGITLDGAGYTITADGYKTSTAANNAGILVSVAGVTIKDLTVVGPNTNTGWDNGEYGIKVYAVDATLEDVTVTGANAGIQITGATLTLKGTIDVSGNEFGGIELAKNSSTSTAAVLDITDATLVNTTEDPTPTAWADAEFDGTITGSGLRGVLNQGNSATQIYWFLAN